MKLLKLIIVVIIVFFFYILYVSGTREQKEPVCETKTTIEVKGFPLISEANEIATYTYNTYGMDYLLLLRAENGAFTKERKHNQSYLRCVKGYDSVNKKRIPALREKIVSENGEEKTICHGTRTAMNDWGLCGISEYYHPSIAYHESFNLDRQRQVDKCVELKKGGTRFYGRDVRLKYKNDFIIKEELICN